MSHRPTIGGGPGVPCGAPANPAAQAARPAAPRMAVMVLRRISIPFSRLTPHASLLHEAALAQVLQDNVLEGRGRRGADIVEPVAVAEDLDLRAEAVEGGVVA